MKKIVLMSIAAAGLLYSPVVSFAVDYSTPVQTQQQEKSKQDEVIVPVVPVVPVVPTDEDAGTQHVVPPEPVPPNK